MKILIINWRSIKDPAAGGAEQVTLEHAKRWVSAHNASVTWVSPKYSNKISEENIDGVMFKYIGIPLGVSVSRLLYSFPIFFATLIYHYVRYYWRNVDVVIEGLHGIPLLTSLYVQEKLILYVQEVAGGIWDKMFQFPINKIGKYTERYTLLTYKDKQIVVGSPTAKHDLQLLGMPGKNITVVHHGVLLEPVTKIPTKESIFTVIFLNRMVKMKGVERTLAVFGRLHDQVPKSQLWLVGKANPEYVKSLKLQAKDLGVDKSVTFFGFVDEKLKKQLLGKAHVLINASYKEGWGLCNIEANTQGTPVVAFDVEGNKDSIKPGISGYLVPDDDLEAMVTAILKIKKTASLNSKALAYSKQFSWDDKANQFYLLLQ